MFYRNILVPIDFSKNSSDAFDFAVKLSLHDGAKVHLIHIIDDFTDGFSSNLSQREDLVSMKFRNANEELNKYINEIPHPRVEIIGALRFGKPTEQILNYCSEYKIDLVVIASHGWSGSDHLIMGNVASHIMESANIPVTCLRTGNTILKKDISNLNTVKFENWIG